MNVARAAVVPSYSDPIIHAQGLGIRLESLTEQKIGLGSQDVRVTAKAAWARRRRPMAAMESSAAAAPAAFSPAGPSSIHDTCKSDLCQNHALKQGARTCWTRRRWR